MTFAAGCFVLEFELADAGRAPVDLLGRDQHLPDVLVGLAEMPLELHHPLAQAAEVVEHQLDFGADAVGGRAHAGVALDLLHHLDRQHEQRRRDQHHAGAERLLHHVVEAVVQLGIDRFRGHEHQRQLVRLARDQVFRGDVADVARHVLAQPRRRLLALLLVARLAIGGHGFERELGVDHQRALVGQEHGAVGTRAVGERVLELVAALGQPVLDDRLHAALAEGAARLLVAEHGAERSHLRGEIGDVLLRAVDDREPLVQLMQVLDRVLGGALHRLAEPVRHRSRAVRGPRARARPGGRRACRPSPAGARPHPPAA